MRRRTSTTTGVLSGVLVALLVMPTVPASAHEASAVPGLPAGFTLVDHASGQAAYNLTNFMWLGGGILTTGKEGTVMFAPTAGSPRTLTRVAQVRAGGDHGMLGLARRNDYDQSGRVYITYDKGSTSGTGYGMVEEWQVSPPDDPTSFTYVKTVLDGRTTTPPLAEATLVHSIDTVVVAPDGALLVSVGDDAPNNGSPNTLRAQDLGQPYGKLLRITPDGSGDPRNPFYTPSAPNSWKSRVYAYGFRNPFRFDLDPRSAMVHLGDVGWNSVEEVNTLRAGDNAGWPCWEGSSKTSFSGVKTCQDLYKAGSARMPITTYPHAGHGASVVGGMHYRGQGYPAKYKDSFFYGDYTRGQIWTTLTDAAGKMVRAPETAGFGLGIGGPVAFHPGPSGDVTYADITTGLVRRLVFASGNRAPSAQIEVSTDADTLSASLSAKGSYDLDGDELSYHWDLGDGTSSSASEVEHTYESNAPVTVTLSVSDELGKTDTTTAVIHPGNHSPTVGLGGATSGEYAVGESVSLSAVGTDPEDGDLDVRWTTALVHCPFEGSCHRHPDDGAEGGSFLMPYTDHGADTTMEITAYVVDSEGARSSATFRALPKVHQVTVASAVAVSIDGVVTSHAGAVEGAEVRLVAPSTSGYRQLVGWSDRGDAEHTMVMPDHDVSLSTTYATQIDLEYQLVKASLGAATTSEYDVAGIPGARGRNYAQGRIYWSSATGAHMIRGAALAKYATVGGPAKLGLPTADEAPAGAGRMSAFARGRIYWSSATGAHLVNGYILTKYLSAGGTTSYGFPTTDVTASSGGWYARFTGGRLITYHKGNGTHLVYGAIGKKYAARGSWKGCLGWPTTDEYSITGGRKNKFVHGKIKYSYSTHRATSSC